MMDTKILVVDDDPNISDLLKIYFENEGYDVKTVADGVEGVNAFKQYEPDLVLLDMKELSARVKAVLRRYQTHTAQKDDDIIRFENIEISKMKYELKIKGKSIDIPPKELDLLYFLASNYNRVFTRDALLDKVWGFDYLGDSRTVDVHVKRLREKLEGVSDKWTLKTVWGVGYKFELLS